MNTQQATVNLMRVAQGSKDDAESLRQIARQLERISAWTEARAVERMADDAERRYAEAVQK